MVQRARPLGTKGEPLPGTRFPSQILGDNVRALRAVRRLKQQDLCERMVKLGQEGWSRVTVSDVERGRRGTSIDELFALAMALQTTVVALLDPFALHSAELAGERPGLDLGIVFETKGVDLRTVLDSKLARDCVLGEDDPWSRQSSLGVVWEGNTPRTFFCMSGEIDMGIPSSVFDLIAERSEGAEQ